VDVGVECTLPLIAIARRQYHCHNKMRVPNGTYSSRSWIFSTIFW
jgi:hypothetical protein